MRLVFRHGWIWLLAFSTVLVVRLVQIGPSHTSTFYDTTDYTRTDGTPVPPPSPSTKANAARFNTGTNISTA